MTFSPYTRAELEQIVTERLKGIPAFDTDAIELCARKVASVSGDVRRALQICRRSVEIFQSQQQQQQQQPNESKEHKSVEMEHIDQAIADLYCSNHTQVIMRSSLHER